MPLAPALTRHDRAARQMRAGRTRAVRAGRIVIDVTNAPAGPVLLVDDVHTTGATLDACARALAKAGSCDITAITYARTL